MKVTLNVRLSREALEILEAHGSPSNSALVNQILIALSDENLFIKLITESVRNPLPPRDLGVQRAYSVDPVTIHRMRELCDRIGLPQNQFIDMAIMNLHSYRRAS
jgi:hypothetical protein